MFEQIHAGYSNPLIEFDDAFMHAWVAEVETCRLRAFLVQQGNEIEAAHRGLRATLSDWLEHPGHGMPPSGVLTTAEHEAERARLIFETTWSPQFSLLRQQLDPPVPDAAVVRAAALALHLHAGGTPGEWSVRFSTPSPVSFDLWQLDDVEALGVQASGHSVDLDLTVSGRRSRIAFRRRDRVWTADGDAPPASPTIVWNGQRITVMPFLRGQQSQDERVIQATEQMLGTLRAALELVDATSPAYSAWVKRLMRIIVPWRLTPGVFHNASTPHCRSCVMMTIHDDVVRVAETFVHEVSHHHFDVLELMGDLVNGRDAKAYYSPPRQENRPLRSILIAHHAFVNVLIFYRLYDMRRRKLPTDYARTVEQLIEWRDMMEEHLAGSDGLTPMGDGLWQHLSARSRLFDQLSAA